MPALLMLLLYIAIVGAVVYLVEAFIPMAEPFKTLIRIIAVVIVIFLLISMVAGGGSVQAPVVVR